MHKFDFLKDYILENTRVRLTPMQIEDVRNLQHFALNEPEIWEFSQQPASGLENLKNYIQMALKGRNERTAYPFVAFDKKIQEYAGSTRFYDYQEKQKTVQLGYTWYGKEFQGTGLNKQCKFLMLDFAFDFLNLERVEFRADARNKRSIAAMKSIGCTVEGILRSNCVAPSGRRDSIVLSILKNEWMGGIKKELLTKIEAEKNNPSI
ncbi:N-acetyltransferase [Aequorivita sp. H23M31]|uniref:N-acetyltransferase n=1 Tax=Aequorivita ciconiae TaxID=2494375 RepID=A0A410FZH7_9FLAO|nr:GNAT family protein [Aequorivita sp. H23M31]QAA80427.1 N-acetyltransferase [Aequorivita sp. H23M31]